jgi:hypothetical protein
MAVRAHTGATRLSTPVNECALSEVAHIPPVLL